MYNTKETHIQPKRNQRRAHTNPLSQRSLLSRGIQDKQDKRDLHHTNKSDLVAAEPSAAYHKRGLCPTQRRPIHDAKETNAQNTQDIWSQRSSVLHHFVALPAHTKETYSRLKRDQYTTQKRPTHTTHKRPGRSGASFFVAPA